MRIALLLFGVGTIANVAGTEKVFVDMANAFVDRGHDVWAVWNDKPGITPYYQFHKAVHQVNLGLGKIKAPLACKMQREINKVLHREKINKVDEYKTEQLVAALNLCMNMNQIDCIVCYEFNSVMAANIVSKGKIPVAVMVHNSIENQIGRLTNIQRKEASKADVYQVLMPSFVKKTKELLTTRIVYIPNVVPQIADCNIADLKAIKKKYRIVHIGRLEGEQKRQFVLVKSFAQLAGKYPDWQLDLYGPVGDEKYKEEVLQFIKEQKLNEQIFYRGITNKPLEILKQADILGFPSAYEGFCLALTEAMSVGLPVVGFASAPSVNELITHEKNGLLAEDEENFTVQLERLMENRELRLQLGSNAHEAMKQYAPDKVWKQWEDLLKELCESKKCDLQRE